MSFINDILHKKKNLKPCQTVITSTTGAKYLESKSDSGALKVEKLQDKGTGFVVDEKLDLQISEILDFLYLSSQDVAQDTDLLMKNKITHVLSIGVTLPPQTQPCEVKFIKFDLLDEPGEKLEAILNQCFDCITEIRESSEKNKILVHCNAGFSRAPTVVISYLMKSLGLSFVDALNVVREKRNVKPNDGFVKQLQEFESKLQN